KAPLALVTLACNRRLTPGSKLQLVVGKGLATPSGVTTQVDKRFGYTVRDAFTAELRCERENAQAACLPIRPMSVVFSAPVPHKFAAALRLRGPQGLQTPHVGEDGDAATARPDTLVNSVRFAPPFAESAKYTLELPQDLQDASGRRLVNAGMFPLAVDMGAMPPLAKFAAAPFGVVERFAEGPDGPALLPVTLRNVEPQLDAQRLQPGAAPLPAQGGTVSTLQPAEDADIIAWLRRVERYDQFSIPRADARADVRGPLPRPLDKDDDGEVQTRMVSLLDGRPG